MQARTSLSDIAKSLGVSVAAVSNAISGKGRISSDLVATIRQKADELGYVPSLAGRALRTGRSYVLGLVLADIANPLFPQIAQAIENAASERGYGVLIGDSHGSIPTQTSAIRRLIERGADGLIIVPRHGTLIGDIDRPFALIDTPSTPGNTVSADHWGGGRQIGRHLDRLGHCKVVVIGGYRDSNVQMDRLGGIRQGLGKNSEVTALWIDEIEKKQEPGCPLGLAAMAAGGATAFAALADLHALRAISELQGSGIDVPDAVTVTGFDDLIWARSISPALTTMQMNMQEIAKVAVSGVIEEIEDRGGYGIETEHKPVAMRLVIRNSCGPPPARHSFTPPHPQP